MVDKIRVLIIDDSAVVRKLLTQILEGDDQLKVVAAVGDPYQGVKKIKELQPDLLTLDVEMPKMNGIKFLKKLMRTYPLPVVMISSLTKRGSRATIKALEYGAVDFVAKLDLSQPKKRKLFKEQVLSTVKTAARVKPKKLKRARNNVNKNKKNINKIDVSSKQRKKIIAIGSSTGGVKALKSVVPNLPANSPGIVLVQHMPVEFTTSFAKTLNQVSEVTVKEAQAGDRIKPGRALLAPGGKHLVVEKKGTNYVVQLNNKAKVHHQRPAVDITFNSLARVAGNKTVGILLTGMGKDGAQGLKKIKLAGGFTIAESKETATIFGMPRKAIELKAAKEVLPLDKIAPKIVEQLSE
ncbi:MAG: protein-glutamate methylesterase/protein-glutamine glutaminase [Bacillota bacterium]